MTPTGAAAYRGRRVLVFGASGFIGRRLAGALAAAGAEVGAVRRSIPPDEPIPGARTIRADLMRVGIASGLLRDFAPATTFNLAGYGVGREERDPALAARINAEFVAEVAEAAGRHADGTWRGQHLIHTGSALEYGIASGDLNEETLPEPTTDYGRTKLQGTRAVSAAVEAGQVLAATARLFTVYGPGERPGRLLPTLLQAARTGEPAALSAGGQRRDFTFVDDVVEGLLRLGVVGDPLVGSINLATGTLASVRQFAERAADAIGMPRSLLHFGVESGRPEEMRHDDVNIDRLLGVCGWKPSTPIEAGVQATVAETADARS